MFTVSSQKLARLIGRRNLTPSSFADECTVDRKTIYRIVRHPAGEAPCQERVVEKILKFLDVSLEDIAASVSDPRERGGKSEGAAAPDSWQQYIHPFDSFIAERTRSFAGDDFLLTRVDAFLADTATRSGYFVVVGEPGIGKSTLLAHVAHKRQFAIHHFNSVLTGVTTARQFFENICARLIHRFNLSHDSFPVQFDRDSRFLEQLLLEAGREANESSPVVLVVDALDEVGDDDSIKGANTLFLPPSLPENVFALLSTRPTHRVRLQVDQIKRYPLTSDNIDHVANIRALVHKYVSEKEIQRWIYTKKLTDDEFVDYMVTKSAGNFMYLRHVLPWMASEGSNLSAGDDLPQDLRQYYEQHWIRMRRADSASFDATCEPVICMLAGFGESVPASLLAKYTKLPVRTVRDILRKWREFLDESVGPDKERRYGIYHKAFRDFLEDKVDPGLQRYKGMIADQLGDEFSGIVPV